MTAVPPRLARYQPLVEDWEAFLASNLAPEPVNLRVRTGLIAPEMLAARLEAQGFELAPVPGLPDARKVVAGPHSVAQTLEHWLGLFTVQQAVMSVPSLALGAQPGERILDLCAAPGGKTTHLAELMEDRGCLVAVDPKEKRLRGLMSNVFRLGHTNVLVLAADGREIPAGAPFDRVLVDAPCSAEGNFRRTGGRLPKRDGKFVRYVAALQEALLRRAIEVVRPGGTVVYATCTWAPEENEAILSKVLADAPVEMEAIPLALPHAPGLTEWNGRRYPDEVRQAWRLYPQHLDSGGAFVARLRKAGGDAPTPEEGPAPGWTPIPPAFPGEDEGVARARIQAATTLLRERFGVGDAELPGVGWMARGENLWAETAGEWPVEGWKAHGGWRVVSLGLRAFRQAGPGREHPSNALLTRLAAHLRKGTLELSDGELGELLSGRRTPVQAVGEFTAGPVEPPSSHPEPPRAEPLLPERPPVDPGPVAARWRGQVLGRGMLSGDGTLDLQVPKAQATRLRALLGLETNPPVQGAPRG